MVATPRTRLRYDHTPAGQYTLFSSGSVFPSSPAIKRQLRTDDVTGNYGGFNPFVTDLSELQTSGLMNGANGFIQFEDVPGAYVESGVNLIDFPDPQSYSTQILSRSGLNTPSLNLPLFAYELKDLPGMLKNAGDLLNGLSTGSLGGAKGAASSTLAYQFGWGPLLGDLGKMMQWSDLVDKRLKELAKAASSEGLRRRVFLFSNKSSASGSSFLHSTWGQLIAANWRESQEVRQWGCITWKQRPNQSFSGPEPSWLDAFKHATGLTTQSLPATVWKALPWSWAIDWFANVSDVLQAAGNQVYYQPTRVGVMTYRQTTRFWDEVQGAISAPHQVTRRTQKRRVQVNPDISLSLRLPIMDSFKMSILGSMLILKL